MSLGPSFDDLREEIHDRAEHLRWNDAAKGCVVFDRLFGATDTLLESSIAASAYEAAFSENIGAKILIAYGFLQSLFVMQDAVRQLYYAVFNEDIILWKIPKLAEIRSARNRIVGHPSRKERDKYDGLGISSAFFPFHDLKKGQYRAHLYLESGSKDIYVDVASWRHKNREELAKLMIPIRNEIIRLQNKLE